MEVWRSSLKEVKMGMLQWGHDKIVMEVGELATLFFKLDRLQWGHDKIVMEVYSLPRYQLKSCSFNGAMTK